MFSLLILLAIVGLAIVIGWLLAAIAAAWFVSGRLQRNSK